MIRDAELTDEEILIAITEADYSPVMSNGVPIGKGFHEKLDLIKGKAVAKAAIAKYRATPAAVSDKQMVKAVAKYLATTHPVSPEMDAEAIVALIRPINAARQDKAVHQAIETTHAAADGTYGAMLAQAVAKERERIGAWLDKKLFNHPELIQELSRAVCTLNNGQALQED